MHLNEFFSEDNLEEPKKCKKSSVVREIEPFLRGEKSCKHNIICKNV